MVFVKEGTNFNIVYLGLIVGDIVGSFLLRCFGGRWGGDWGRGISSNF